MRHLLTGQNIHPSKSRVSEDGSFDEETIRAIAAFQTEKGLGTKKPGVIDGATRAALEAAFPETAATFVGPNLKPRILVPASASDAARFEFYQKVIEEAGGVFEEERVNIVGIRGVKVDSEKGSLRG